jgi:hypothetical protein
VIKITGYKRIPHCLSETPRSLQLITEKRVERYLKLNKKAELVDCQRVAFCSEILFE